MPDDGLDRRTALMAVGAIGMSAMAWESVGAEGKASAPAVQALIDEMVLAKAFPGAVAAIGAGEGATLFASGGTAAFDSDRRVDRDSLWRIYSMTKPITGMAAMLLIAEKRIGLDQPIAELLPEFQHMQLLVAPEAGLGALPAKHAITVRHLLTHTAGLGYADTLPAPLAGAYRKAGLIAGRDNRTIAAAAPTAPSLAEFSRRLATLPLMSEPGGRWRYSLGLDVLGRVIEVASGMPFDAYLRTRLFEPLGMRSTFFQVPERDAERLVSSYSEVRGKVELLDPAPTSVYLDPPPFPSGGGGLLSTAYDYDRFLHMLASGGSLNGTRVMPAAAVALGVSNLLPAGADMSGYVFPGGTDGFGAGGRVGLTGPGAGTYGWLGAAGSIGMIDVRRKRRMTGIINVKNSFLFTRRLPEAMARDLA